MRDDKIKSCNRHCLEKVINKDDTNNIYVYSTSKNKLKITYADANSILYLYL